MSTMIDRHQILATTAVCIEIGGLSRARFAPLGKRGLKGLAEELELSRYAPTMPRGESAPRAGRGSLLL
jgi:hypothetical protein